MNENLYLLIQEAHDGNVSAILAMITRFLPLIKNIASRLSAHTGMEYDDIISDIQLCYVIMLRNTDWGQIRSNNDGVIVQYISVSLRNIGKKLYRKYTTDRIVTYWDDLSEFEQRYVEKSVCIKDAHDEILFGDLRSHLSHKEYRVIVGLYYYGFTVIQLAEKLHISRQAVNQLKNNAIKKLRRHYCTINENTSHQ